MGYWLIAAIALQLACAFCAARLDRPAVWLQCILLVPVLGALAFCAVEAARALSAMNPRPVKADGENLSGAALGGFGYRAVCARTTKSRRALAEECMQIGRHADARLLIESCRDGTDAESPEPIADPDRAAASPGRFQQ